MSLDRSLKSGGGLIRHRNVLTRDERLKRLKEEEKWTDSKSVFGLPKVANRKLELVKTAKEETAAADGVVAAAPGAKGAAPGAKGAAPAAKGAAGAKGAAAAKGAAPAAKGAAPAAKGAAPAKKK